MATNPTPDDYIRVVNTLMDTLKLTFEEAIEKNVPPEAHGAVRELFESQQTQQITRVRGVSQDGGPKAWFADWEPAGGYYWQRQRNYLLDTVGRSPEAVEATDDDSSRVLSYLPDPRPQAEEAFDARGLVLGYVQSGKTENFSAVIAKAADLGYQVIIVLSGIHNGLRQQTQRRLERELGLEPVEPGVGLPTPGKRWNNPTTADIYGDFEPGTSDPSILQGNEKVIFIIKKWHTVLTKLNDFVDKADVPKSLPVLVIDDEADQASINTGGNRQPLAELVDQETSEDDLAKETNPSATNRLLRELLSKFQRVAYIGYTATPFANVLIDHDAEDRDVYRDLFPRDFILTPYPRPGYVGASRLFGRPAFDDAEDEPVEGLDVVRRIPDADMPAVTPSGVKIADFEPSVPASLDLAFDDWVLATAGMLARAHVDKPSCMLIHIHQRTDIQLILAPQIEAMVRDLRNAWRYDREGPVRARLRDRWETEFRPVTRRIDADRDRPFHELEEHIDRLMKDGVPVLTLNSKTEDALDYEQDPNLKAVLIGGNRLSRGMTLEGLTVSYYVRETPYYDTLLQMGRWFGYREWYVDLTRIWTTPTLATWFRDLALREDELREQILQAERDRLSPLQVGYKIRSHPAMMVTAQNKMGAGRQENLSYSGKMIQTSRFKLRDPGWLAVNLAATKDFLGRLGKPGMDASGVPLWTGVDPESVAAFLGVYRTVQDRTSFDADAAAKYIRSQLEQGPPELTSWTVAVGALNQEIDALGTVDLGIEGVEPVNAISRTRLKIDTSSIGVLTNPGRANGPIRTGDEEIGLSDEQILAARQAKADGDYERIRDALLAQRGPEEGLLVVYPISRYSKPRTIDSGTRMNLFDDPDATGESVIGLAIGFPPSKSAATIEYVAGSVGAGEEE